MSSLIDLDSEDRVEEPQEGGLGWRWLGVPREQETLGGEGLFPACLLESECGTPIAVPLGISPHVLCCPSYS